MKDYYTQSAEFYDIVAGQHWLHSDPALESVLAGIATSHGPVLDLGAGTGRSTEVVARTLPEAHIIAVEPSPGMRAVLTSRVVRNPDLRHRVTVVASTAQEVVLPDRLSAAVICGVAGYLDQRERQELWRRLRERLAVGAPVVVELMAVSVPQHVAPMRIARETVGEQIYEAWLSGEPSGPDRMRWKANWRVWLAGALVRELDVEHEWFTFGVDDLASETGMTGRQITPELAVLT